MSTREQRRAWQEFRERHGVSLSQFRKKWLAMFGRQPKQMEIDEYNEMRDRLRAPLGRKKKPIQAIVDVDRAHDAAFKNMEGPHELTCPSRPELGGHGWATECDCADRVHIGIPYKVRVKDVSEDYSSIEHLMKVVTVTKRYEWDMGHRLPEHQGKCRRLHGHRYVAEVDVTGPVATEGPSAGMVMDFYGLKLLLDDVIGQWDHRTMLYREDPLWLQLGTMFEGVPAEDWGAFAVPFMPTAENICHQILTLLQQKWKGVDSARFTRVRVYETPSGWAEVKA